MSKNEPLYVRRKKVCWNGENIGPITGYAPEAVDVIDYTISPYHGGVMTPMVHEDSKNGFRTHKQGLSGKRSIDRCLRVDNTPLPQLRPHVGMDLWLR